MGHIDLAGHQRFTVDFKAVLEGIPWLRRGAGQQARLPAQRLFGRQVMRRGL
jgi:hypothetical protein